MITIFTETTSPRLQYAAQFIFGHCANIPFEIVSSKDNVVNNENVLCYGVKEMDSRFTVFQHEFVTNSQEPNAVEFEKITENEWPFFKAEKDEWDENTDVFSYCFFVLSRYEEYVNKGNDDYGRFCAEQSIFKKQDLIYEPHLDRLVNNFLNRISKKFPEFNFTPKYDGIEIGFDIDHSWKYREKGFVRNAAGLLKAVFCLKWRNVKDRIAILSKIKADPYNSFDEILKLGKKVKICFFILFGTYNRLDINISRENKRFKKLIQNLSKEAKIGLHPSWASNKDISILKNEKTAIESVINESITSSRQHFLILKLPETYQNLLEIGIKEDNSMGFADDIGFRTGTAHSFYWFDFKTNNSTDLLIKPFVAMDVSMRDYRKFSAKEAFQKLEKINSIVHKYGGTFRLVWHNSSFIETEDWQDWKKELVQFVSKESFS